MKILNLYAGIGGNRKLWGNEHQITAVEIDEQIAGIYKGNYPQDKVIVGDAHQYLLDHYKEFDFIWSSPPCPTHSRLNFAKKEKSYPSMVLYQEIIFLQSWFKGKFCVENVMPYYDPLIKPFIQLGRHYFWTNFNVAEKEFTNIDVARSTQLQLSEELGINIPRHKARLLLRNALKPEIALHIIKEIKNE